MDTFNKYPDINDEDLSPPPKNPPPLPPQAQPSAAVSSSAGQKTVDAAKAQEAIPAAKSCRTASDVSEPDSWGKEVTEPATAQRTDSAHSGKKSEEEKLEINFAEGKEPPERLEINLVEPGEDLVGKPAPAHEKSVETAEKLGVGLVAAAPSPSNPIVAKGPEEESVATKEKALSQSQPRSNFEGLSALPASAAPEKPLVLNLLPDPESEQKEEGPKMLINLPAISEVDEQKERDRVKNKKTAPTEEKPSVPASALPWRDKANTTADPEDEDKVFSQYDLLTPEDKSNIRAEIASISDTKLRGRVLANKCFIRSELKKFEEQPVGTGSGPTLDFLKSELDLHKKYISNYRTHKCAKSTAPDHDPACIKYHDESRERRRIPVLYESSMTWNYYPVMCGSQECPLGGECRLAHTQAEIDYHPMVYKSDVCKNRAGELLYSCEQFGPGCPAAHSISDLRDIQKLYSQLKQPAKPLSSAQKPTTSLKSQSQPAVVSKQPKKRLTAFSQDTYKTLKCPEPTACQDPMCLHYHNPLEQRRPPSKFRYVAEICPEVYRNGRFVDPTMCMKGNFCEFCHTKNELYYHADNFRKKECTRRPCRYGPHCPDIHRSAGYAAEPEEKKRRGGDTSTDSVKGEKRKVEKLQAKIAGLEKELAAAKSVCNCARIW